MSTYNEREKRLDDLKNKITTLKKEMSDLEHELYKMNEENDFLEFMSTRNDNIQINNI
jgi:regulator of replication initiation timing